MKVFSFAKFPFNANPFELEEKGEHKANIHTCYGKTRIELLMGSWVVVQWAFIACQLLVELHCIMFKEEWISCCGRSSSFANKMPEQEQQHIGDARGDEINREEEFLHRSTDNGVQFNNGIRLKWRDKSQEKSGQTQFYITKWINFHWNENIPSIGTTTHYKTN